MGCVKNSSLGCQREGDKKEVEKPKGEHVLMRLNVTQCFHRRDVRELGMTLVINARKKTPPPHLYKALLMAQVKTCMQMSMSLKTQTEPTETPHDIRCQSETVLNSLERS